MWGYADADEQTRSVMRGQILAFLDEYCRDLTLRDAGRWYDEALRDDGIAQAS